jgi:hypothetical protein
MRLVNTIVRSSFLVVALLSATVADLAGQQPEEGTRFRANVAEITFAGRVQTQFNTTTAEGVAPSEMLLRRVRLSVTVRVNETVSGRFQPEFAGDRLQLGDAYMQLTASPGLNLLAGRAFRPFSIMEQTSATQMIPIERGLRIRGVQELDLSSLLTGRAYADRDVGIQLRGAPVGAPVGLNYAFGVFAGPLQGAVGDRLSQQYVGRVSILPIARTRVGAAISRRDFVAPGAAAIADLSAGNAFVLDVEHGGPTPTPGLHIVGQLVTGDFDPSLGTDFSGGQLWVGYRLARSGALAAVEPLARVSRVRIDRIDGAAGPAGGTLVTPGINFYFGGLNRVMLNYDFWNPVVGTREGGMKAQFQLAF